MTADLVISLNRHDLPYWAVERARELVRSGGNACRRFGIHCPLGKSHLPLLKDILKAVAAVLPRDCGVEIIWFDDTPGSHAYHKAVTEEVLPWARVVPYQNRWVIASLIGELDALLTTKLHVGITAWALGVPSFGLSSHPKTKRFYRQIQRPEFHADLEGTLPVHSRMSRLFGRLGIGGHTGLSNAQHDLVSSWLKEFLNSPHNIAIADNPVRCALQRASSRNFEVVDRMLDRVNVH